MAPATRNASWQILFKCHTPAMVFGNATKPSRFGMFCSLLTRCTIPCACHVKRHLNLQKWREHVVFCTFWLRNVLRATTACTFSTSQLPKVVRHWCACTFWLRNVLRATTACNFSSLLWPAGSAPAALASLLFDPPEPQIIGKMLCFATPHLFAHLYLLSSYSFPSDLLSANLPLLSASALLCFSSLHIVGSLTSKLPSIICHLLYL